MLVRRYVVLDSSTGWIRDRSNQNILEMPFGVVSAAVMRCAQCSVETIDGHSCKALSE
jgi:hypothetical protein